MVKRSFDELFPTPAGPHGMIQWAGTTVCMDVVCACGWSGHVDDDFCYAIECPACGARYALGCHVALVRLSDEEQRDYSERYILPREGREPQDDD